MGVGCTVNSCRGCDNCRVGLENDCLGTDMDTSASLDRDDTIAQAGYSTRIVADQSFMLRAPDTVPYEGAAPLLCAGITT